MDRDSNDYEDINQIPYLGMGIVIFIIFPILYLLVKCCLVSFALEGNLAGIVAEFILGDAKNIKIIDK